MFGETRTDAGESFQQRLQRLRIKFDALPETQRHHLYELADAIAEQQRQLTRRMSQRDDAQ